MIRPPTISTLFPYTTLFRSWRYIARRIRGAGTSRRIPWSIAYRSCKRRSNLRSEEHTSELQSLTNLVCRLLLEKKKTAGSEGRQEDFTHGNKVNAFSITQLE